MSTMIRTAGATIAALALLLPLAAAAAEEDDDLTALAPVFTAAGDDPALGPVLSDRELAAQRGGDVHVNQNNATATVEGNVASNLSTGNNTIGGNAFTSTTGIPMIVQNSGNNVVIQNSTILNLQLQ